MPVAAAAATIPLLRVCRNLVVFLLEEVKEKKTGLGTGIRRPRPAVPQAEWLMRYVVSR
jgi:hypothetical protein